MNQILHIFRKDARHLYPEIAVTFAALIAFASSAPLQWKPNWASTGGFVFLVPVLLRVLLPIAWLVLISRLVHEESLVGDRQFWITRPYRWGALLAAKILFVFLFLSLPFMLMQVYLVQHAGLDIRSSIPDLLLYQLRLSAIFFIPFFAIAAVTSNFARLTLSLLLGCLYLGLLFAIGNHVLDGHLLPHSLAVAGLIFFALALLSLILFQYARRRTFTVRSCLLALPVLLLLLGLVAPAKSLTQGAHPTFLTPQWSIDRNPARQQTANSQPVEVGGLVFLKLPVHQITSSTGERFKVNGVTATIDAPGLHWSSPFVNNTNDDLSDAVHDPTITAVIPKNIYDQVRATPVDLHLQFVSTAYATSAATQERASTPAFPAPDHGLCPLTAEGIVGNCRYAYRLATPIDIAAPVSAVPCDSVQAPIESQPATPALNTFIGSDDDRLAFDFDPVATTPLSLVLPGSTFDHPLPAFLCKNSAVSFTSHPILRRGSFSITAQGLVLDNYAQRGK